ncbi:MAG TPA: hypothetical protein PKY59_21100 [Pyrinomonadaceae bacterium]|nr:hypothetical protein [Pyrinomonadaceae bacterium]
MKSVFRFSVIGVLTLAFAGAAFAQDPCADSDAYTAKYTEFTTLYPKTDIESRKAAVKVAKEYIEKWGKCPDLKQQVDYFNNYVPTAEKNIKDIEEGIIKKQLYVRFDNGLKAKNWDDVYASGKEILARKDTTAEDKLNITILFGSIGFDEARNNNDKYNAETIKYAEEALKMIDSGVTSKDYGIGIIYKSKAFDTPEKAKANAIGWLNYNIAFLKANRAPKDLKGALPYLYKVTQTNSAPKSYPNVYLLLGDWYLAETQRIDKERVAAIEANNKEDNDQTKAMYALQKGYADRTIDAYARAYNLYTAPADKAAKDEVYDTVKELYKFRNNNKETGLDSFISSVKAKPIPDPSSAVTPVVEAAPAETTTTGKAPTPSTTTPDATTNKPATTKPATAKPATTTGTKPAASTTKTPATNTAATTATPAKKPAPKKKGTR